MPDWLNKLLPILVLLTVVIVVLRRLPKVELGHSDAFRSRRVANWLPVGIAYAFLYMGRYNLTAYKNAVGMTNDAYGSIDGIGAIVYGLSFILNGPLTDRFGGRVTMLAAVIGAGLANGAMGFLAQDGWSPEKVGTFSLLYGVNMYFQSFGAVSIVKVNAAWFHLRERGTFGGIFGILISLGLYFSYDWTRWIAEMWGVEAPKGAAPIAAAVAADYWVFWVPALLLFLMAVLVFMLVRDTPGHAGHDDFDTGDAGSGDTGGRKSLGTLVKLMLTNKAILTITAIEFCSGYLRNAVMKWYQVYAKAVGESGGFVAMNWGMLLCCAGILGGVFAGSISDHVFNSRRGPVAAILYGGMVLGSGGLFFLMGSPALGWMVIFMSLCIIGVHGMLSGTASMDFGGKANVGIVVGIIDGFVYLGSATQSIVLKKILPESGSAAAADPASWITWAYAMLPVGVIGLLLSLRVWNARAQRGGGGH
ncbi:MFS transporter [Myxococcota bacterium]|nr:MFS transporter [Myxococcota bacterium]